MRDKYIYKFYDEVNQVLEGDYKIILEPNRDIQERLDRIWPSKMGNGRRN